MTNEDLKKVKDLINQQTMTWNMELLNSLFDKPTVANIAKIYIPSTERDDEMIWSLKKNGEHSVKFFYLKNQDVRFNKGNERF